MKAALPLLAGLILLAGGARAEDLADRVPAHGGLTWFDLMKLVVTDLAPDGKNGGVGHAVVPFTHIAGEKERADPPGQITLGFVEVMAVPYDPARVIVLADLGQSEGNVAHAMVLALFALSPAKLLDIVEVGNDRDTFLHEGPPLALAPGAPLIIVESGHGASDQRYQGAEMIFLHGDRLRLVDSVFTFSDNDCVYDRIQTPVYQTLPDVGQYSAVRVVVTETVTRTGADCDADDVKAAPRPGVRTWQATWRWDARRGAFVTGSKELDRLADEDAKRF